MAGPTCCGQSFGSNSASAPDRFTFTDPIAGCTKIVVRTISLTCNTGGGVAFDPDIGQFAVVIESTTGAGCGACTIFRALLIESSGRTTLKVLNNGPVTCNNLGTGNGSGVNASIACNDPLLTSSARLAVQLNCLGGVVGCVPP